MSRLRGGLKYLDGCGRLFARSGMGDIGGPTLFLKGGQFEPKAKTKWVKGVGMVTQPGWFEKTESGDERTPAQDFAGGDDRGVVVGYTRPETKWTAMMIAAPGDTVQQSETEYREERYRKADIVQEVIADPSVLSELERLVIQLKFFSAKSWRDSEEIMRALRAEGVSPSEGVAKSYLQRVSLRAEQKLKVALSARMSELYPNQRSTP